ncbi:hypothetical protein PENCOP_c036G02803 [Penicillium coprophilum]|uniref:Uncharacterized protein n=1 Tax=Penicillium coprophilum TaxID=36646 RepID=A0A1V6U6F6_9EURO|nr:hypothetical protein PENCOP_c036G02803 [Penicillium coprophilum]
MGPSRTGFHEPPYPALPWKGVWLPGQMGLCLSSPSTESPGRRRTVWSSGPARG